ncbi:N-acetyltransferase 9 [Striga asiatica]|uniref:N-acetyltransferase 9 n=1 Tax=Striga asiatica TaxID=4170 RepID=A0A5A7Q2I1_STRAF|nr:N-acetyltransferase 9 [Striga asiatica]
MQAPADRTKRLAVTSSMSPAQSASMDCFDATSTSFILADAEHWRSERKFVGEIFLDLYDLSDMCDEQHLHTKVADIFAKDDVYDPLGIKEREHKAKALAAMVGA